MRTWLVVCLLVLLATLLLWRVVDRRTADAGRQAAPAAASNQTPRQAAGATAPGGPAMSAPAAGSPQTNPPALVAVNSTNRFRHRLSNTTGSVDSLARSDSALLLRNAHLDSTVPINLAIPPHLRAEGDPGSYIVQSRGPITDAFRARLLQAGLEVVSYVPNNAYLVRGSREAVGTVGEVQAVLAWEPYFKLDYELLTLAVEQRRLFSNTRLNLLLFPGERARVVQALLAMEAVVLGEDRTPFGPQLVVRPQDDGLVAIAQLPGVQVIELHRAKTPANDLARERVRVSTNTIVANNFRDLTGEGILVNVNDTGVEAAHLDLFDRVTGDSLFTLEDFDGHGTHVAGTIASSGVHSPLIPPKFVGGSVTNANFRGMAPAARIYALPINSPATRDTPDTYLQENPAKTNALISNNSWGYFGSATYTISSASWDAAVRDALPGQTGSQPLIAVFSAGNRGEVDGAIDAPGTAKNVITVGALENLRNITNEVVRGAPPNQRTNRPWASLTDSREQIASFTSLGNVDPDGEGPGGRFKPDLVAPGTFTVSTRSSHWVQPTNLITLIRNEITFERIRAGRTNVFTTFMPSNGVRLDIICVTNPLSPPAGLPPLPIHVRPDQPPDSGDYEGTNSVSVGTTNAVGQTWQFSVANTNAQDLNLNIRYFVAVTNDLGNEPEVMFNLQSELKDHYRFESGTSMAAPVVSGMLALMQEYCQNTLQVTNSPALMKALLINGARRASDTYGFSLTNQPNTHGWGLPNLTNSLPNGGLRPTDGIFNSGTLVWYEQNPKRILGSGESHTRIIDLTPAATIQPLRITLVWTDPPGNPAVGIKLVNDLDLIVTNLTTLEVYYVGNGISEGSVVNDPISLADSNAVPSFDYVNNVENIFLGATFNQRLDAKYSVTVRARRVNVNAVTAQTNGIAQDYALVISSGTPRAGTATIAVSNPEVFNADAAPWVTAVTNGIPLLNQRVGANDPLLASTNGELRQWRFYTVPNQLPPSDPLGTNGPPNYIAFATFLPPNLSRTRFSEADVDLFVSADPALTNLDVIALEDAWRSSRRGGTESIVLSNVAGIPTFYAAVKSEDQQSANYAFFAVSSSSPFSNTDTNGNVYMRGYPRLVNVPDGAPSSPQAEVMLAFHAGDPITVQNVVVTNDLTHLDFIPGVSFGDLFGTLQLNGEQLSVLNANRSFFDNTRYIYDDSDSGEIPESTRTDAPGTLRNFVGEEGLGLWQLTMVDSAPALLGRMDDLFIRLEPRKEDLTNGVGIVVTIRPGRWFYTAVDVPADATNLTVCVGPEEGPLEVYIARGFFPDQVDYDIFATIQPPGDCVSLTRRDSPPLSQGRYFIGVFNPNASPVTARIRVLIERDLAARTTVAFRSSRAAEIFDDALTNSIIHVGRRGTIADFQVGVRIEHPRVSDLVLHLTSPQGTRLLLAENRGGPDGANYGFGSLLTNSFDLSAQGDNNPTTNIVFGSQNEGTVEIDYNFFGVPDSIQVLYEGQLLFESGLISGAGTFSVDYGPGLDTNVVIVMNAGGNPNAGTRWVFTARIVSGYVFATFTDNTNFARVPIKFATPPFTNFNYTAFTFVTNAVVLEEGFDATPGACPLPHRTGTIFAGWEVLRDSVDVLPGSCGLAGLAHSLPHFVDMDGQEPGIIRTNFTTIPGMQYNLSFAYTQNPNTGPHSALVSLLPGPGFVISSDQPNSNTNLIWQSSVTSFTATAPATALQVESLSPCCSGGMFVDTFKVEQIDTKTNTGIYFQPEEPLLPLRGQEAFGDWQLEIWDNRVGAVLTNVLLAWKMNITFVNTNPPTVRLTNGLAYCSTLLSNQTAYFVFDVPVSASVASNIVVASENVSLLYSAVGIPLGQEPPDTFFFRDAPAGTAILDGGGWNSRRPGGALLGGATFPQLRPGFRYYLAVRNEFPDTNAFCVTVSCDNASGNLVPITRITNNACVFQSFTSNRFDYYFFDVSTNALGAEFTITNIAGGDPSLYVRRGLPLPTPTQFFANSTNLGLAPEFIQVGDLTGRLMAGRWFIAVENNAGGMSYQICVREIPGTVIPLPVNTTLSGNAQTNAVDYYRVVIPPNAFQADFRTIEINGDVDLYLSRNTMLMLNVAPTNAMFQGATNGDGDELIRLSVFNAAQFLSSGTWYLAVISRTGVPVDYSVRVDIFTTNLNYITLTNGIAYSNQVASTNPVGLYHFVVSPDAIQTVFETFAATGDVDLYIRWGSPLPPPGTNWFDFAGTNTPSGTEWIALVTGSPAYPLIPGPWWIGVVPKAGATLPVDYQVRATQILRSEVARLQNGATVCAAIQPVDTNVLHSGAQFYRFDVGPDPIRALFEVVSTDGNVDLYLQYGLPITNYTLITPPLLPQPYPYSSELGGLARDSICVLTNGIPVPLTNGTWYLTVVNRDRRDVSYCLRATALLSNDIPRLGDGLPQCDIVGTTNAAPFQSVDYFVFNVAPGALQATFETLFSSGNVDLYVTKALPVTDCTSLALDPATFTYSSTSSGRALESICLRSPAAGDWYVAVVNRATNTPVTYCVRATQLTPANLTQVIDGSAGCRTIGVGNGAMNSGIDYWSINITNAPALATFEAFGLTTGNVDMYLVRDGGCLPNFAAFNSSATNYPYASENPGISPECIMLESNTPPVPLTNGNWYVAIVNRSPVPVDYCFLYTTFVTNPSTPLTNNVATCGLIVPPTNSTGGIGVNYYVFNVSTNALAATFSAYGANGNVDIYLQHGFCFAHRNTFDLATVNGAYWSTNSGTNADFICVDRGATPLPLEPGDWYVAVVNRETNDVNFCFMAREITSDSSPLLTNAVPSTATLPLAPLNSDYYRYVPSSNAVQVNFEILGADGDVNLYLDPGLCQNNPQNFSYASTNGGTTNELIVVATNSFPVPLVVGDWLLAVTSAEPALPVNYTIRVTEVYASDIVRLTNAVPYSSTVDRQGSITNFPVDYYVFEVSTNAVRAQFEILAPSGNVNLVARKGLPLPSPINADYLSANSGLSDELIVVRDTSLPVPLSPGDWYLAVLNTTANPVTYTVQATEHASAGTNLSIGGVTLASNQFCLTWVNLLPEVNYYVQGKADLSDPAWIPVSPTLRAASGQVSWCIPLPSPYHFFRLVEGLSPLSAGSPVAVSSMTFTPGNVTLQWTAPSGLRFSIEWSDTLSSAVWTPYPDYITSATTTYTFTDDGSQTAPLGQGRFYRILLVPW